MNTILQQRPSNLFHRTLGLTMFSLTALLFALSASPAMAAIQVDSTAWGDDGTAACTLWEAVQTFRTLTPVGGCTGSGEIELQEGALYETQGQLPKINGALGVQGNGATLQAAPGSADHRFFNIGGQATLHLENLTLTQGLAARGGAIWISSGGTLTSYNLHLSLNQATVAGGAIFSRGTVDLNFATLSENTAPNGGAISADDGQLDIINSTFYLNSASNHGGAVAAWADVDPLTFRNSTFSRNSAYKGGALFRRGAAGSSPDSIIQVTFKGNEVLPLGSGNTIYLENGRAFAMEKTALHSDDATSSLCAGDLTGLASGGHNAATDASCGLTHADDHPAAQFALSDLVDHGAYTKVHAPLCDAGPGAGYECSILFDQYPCETPPNAKPDQRGVHRFNFGDGFFGSSPRCDIGAYESICRSSVQSNDTITTFLITDQYKSDGNVLNNGACAGVGETAYFETVPEGGCHMRWDVFGIGLDIHKVWFIEDEATCPVDCFNDPEGCKLLCTSDPDNWVDSLPAGLREPSPETTPNDHFILDAPTCDVPRSRYVMQFVGGRVEFWDPEAAIETGGGA